MRRKMSSRDISKRNRVRRKAAKKEDDEACGLEDDRLRLIFTCCHPSLAPEARVALTLREVCGLTTEEIAKAFLTTPRTLAQRIVRAKAKIRDTPIRYEVPTPQELPERLGAVLQVIYLVFNEGYSAAAGAEVTRAELTGEAIRLGRLLAELQAGAGSHWAAFPDVAAGIPSRRENIADRRADFAGEAGSLALEPGADRGGSGIAGESADSPAASALTHCRVRLRPFMRRRNRWRRPTGGRLLRSTTNWHEFSLRRLYSSIVPWPLPCAMVPEAGLAQIDAVLETWRIGELLPGAFRPRRYVPQARQDGGGSVLL